MSFKQKFFSTQSSWAGTIARITLGVVMLPHGLQKTLGLFGGYGFSATLDGLQNKAGLPLVVALLVILGESLGALGLIFGFLTRFAALGIGLIMLGAIFMAHGKNGFFMNWFGAQQGEGYEYHLLAVGLSLVILIVGAGKYSIDSKLSK